MDAKAYDDEHDHTHDLTDTGCSCGRPWDLAEQEGECIDCGNEWEMEGRVLHFGAIGMFCCWCAESRANGEHHAL